MGAMSIEPKKWLERLGATLGVVALAAMPALVQMSPETFDANVAGWQHRLVALVNQYHLAVWIALAAGVAISVWFLRSGDPERLAKLVRKYGEGMRLSSPMSATKIAPLPEHEVTLRIKALDELREAIECPAKDAYARLALLLSNHRSLILEIEGGRDSLLEAVSALRESFQKIKRNVRTLSEKHRLAFPALVHNNFPEAQDFHASTLRMEEGLRYLQLPYTHSQVSLLQPWIQEYSASMEHFHQWVKNCVAQIMIMRADTLERMRP